MLFSLLAFFPPLVCASIGLARFVAAFQAYARLQARPTTALSDLVEGPIEVEGILRTSDSIEAVSGVSCAALKVRGAFVEAGSSRKAYHVSKTFVTVAESVLDDGKGHRIALEGTHQVAIQAPSFVGGELPIREVPPLWRERFGAAVHPAVTHFAVEEFRIESGAWVTIQGVAERVEGDGSDYRGGPTFRLVPPPGEPLLIFEGKEAAARRRAILICGAMALALIVLLDITIQVFRVV